LGNGPQVEGPADGRPGFGLCIVIFFADEVGFEGLMGCAVSFGPATPKGRDKARQIQPHTCRVPSAPTNNGNHSRAAVQFASRRPGYRRQRAAALLLLRLVPRRIAARTNDDPAANGSCLPDQASPVVGWGGTGFAIWQASRLQASGRSGFCPAVTGPDRSGKRKSNVPRRTLAPQDFRSMVFRTDGGRNFRFPFTAKCGPDETPDVLGGPKLA